MDKLVSVIVPTHGRPQLLRRALESVARQTYRPVEAIVVENGGNPQGRPVAEQLRRLIPVRYLYQERPDPHIARNAGIRAAAGAYCALLDDDDEWLPGKLERQIGMLERDPGLGWISSDAWRVDELGRTAATESPFYNGVPSFHALVTEWCFIWSLSGVVVRREVFDTVGLFSTRYWVAGDYELYLRMARRYRFAHIAEPLFRYYQHTGNMTRNRDKVWNETLQVLRSLKPDEELGVTQETIREAIDRYCRWIYSFAIHARESKRFDDAARYFLFALRYDPLIGARVSWGRFHNRGYRALRPYLGLLSCSARHLLTHRRAAYAS